MSNIKDFISYINTTQLQRAAAFLLIIFLGVGMGVGFSVAISDARKAAEKDIDRESAVFSRWQTQLTSQLTTASALSSTMGAFVMATVNTPANLSAPAAARMKYVDQAAIDRLGQKVYFSGITSMVIAPGGVITQMYPPGAARFGLDMLNSDTYRRIYPRFYNATGMLTTGPSLLSTRPVYGIFVWFPIHISNVTTKENFWGVSYILIEIPRLLASMNFTELMAEQSMDYVLWYTTADNGTIPTIINESDTTSTPLVMEEGMRMELPISETGRTSYLAIHPKGGLVSPDLKAGTAVIIVVITIVVSVAAVLILYLIAFAHFQFRHRRAPSNKSQMFMAAFALRGAQPFADKTPLVAVQMFNDFADAVRKLALDSGCYPVCEIGDRCVFVVSRDPQSLMRIAQSAVLEVSVRGCILPGDNTTRPDHRSSSYTKNNTIGVAKTAMTTSQVTEDMSESSFVSSAVCRVSVACHTVTAACVYDEAKDTYFYGTAAQLGKLCSALDMAKCGEMCWTDSFETNCQQLCRGVACAALTSHTVSENGEVVLHVASWWKESGDERDNEDPSTAMAVLSDAYVRRMAVIVSQGKLDAREQRRKQGEETKSGSSNKSTEATSLTRTATLLHVAIISGDEKRAIEVVRRIVSDEKGAVVSAYESTIVATFNLLSAGGHHQVRAADTVMRLREALPNTHFACSLNHGKVQALIMDGLVMCSGEPVTRGRALLQAAIALSTPHGTHASDAMATYLPSELEAPTSPTTTKTNKSVHEYDSKRSSGVDYSLSSKRHSSVAPSSENGICLLMCLSELNSSYDCEAVDAVTFGNSRPKVVYRLAYKRCAKGNDDEWMYKMKDEEDGSPFAVVNAVFERIASNEQSEAARLWRTMDRSLCTQDVSCYAKASLARHLKI